MNSKQVLEFEINKLRDELIQSYEAKGMRASGKWADGLEVFVSELKGTLFGLDYSQQLESGRSTNNGSSGQDWDTWKEDIEQWIYDKGIDQQIDDTITVSSLAYLIARKIWRQGWDRADHGGVELISEIITPKRLESILNKLTEAYLVEYTSEIQTTFAEAF